MCCVNTVQLQWYTILCFCHILDFQDLLCVLICCIQDFQCPKRSILQVSGWKWWVQPWSLADCLSQSFALLLWLTLWGKHGSHCLCFSHRISIVMVWIPGRLAALCFYCSIFSTILFRLKVAWFMNCESDLCLWFDSFYFTERCMWKSWGWRHVFDKEKFSFDEKLFENVELFSLKMIFEVCPRFIDVVTLM